MTPKNRKTLLICLGIVVASYIVRNIVIGAMQIAYYQKQMMRQRQQPKPKPKAAPPAAKAPAEPASPSSRKAARGHVATPVQPKPAPSPFAKLSGIWRGRTAIDGRGVCDLKFELREKPEAGHFSGYTTMTCNGAGQLMANRRVNAKERTLNAMNPEAAILSGALEKRSIEFTVDKAIGTDSNGCAPTSFSLTPFGAGQLAAEWQEGACSGGHLVLRRARQ